MRDGLLWKISRHLYDDKITGRSGKVALGVAVGVLATGGGILPALVGVSATMAVASAMQGAWDSYKRSTGQVSHRQLHEAHLNSLAIPHSGTPHSRASAYNNFYDTLARFSTQTEVGGEHLSMMSGLKSAIASDIENTSATGKPTGPLPDLHEQAKRLLGQWAQKTADRTLAKAINFPVQNGLHEAMEYARALDLANRAQDVLIEEGFDNGNAARQKTLLRDKLAVLQNTIATKGVDTMGFPPEGTHRQIAYLHGEMARLASALSPAPAPTRTAQHPVVQNNEEQFARHRAVENAWFATFAKDAPAGARGQHETPQAVAAVYEAFHETLSGVAKRYPQELTVRSMEMASLMHERLQDAIVGMQPSGDDLARMQELVQKTAALLGKYSPQVVVNTDQRIQTAPRMGGSGESIQMLGCISDALAAQALAERFAAPEQFDAQRTVRLTAQAKGVQATLALGIDESTLGGYTLERAKQAITEFNRKIEQAVAAKVPSTQPSSFSM